MAFNFTKNLTLFFLIVIILAVFSFGFYFGKAQCEICPPEQVDFSLFWEAWSEIEESFVDRKELDIQEMIYGAISGMIESLNDPYTVFLRPEEAKRFIEGVRGAFEGVGMEIGIKKGQLQVIAPLEGTPAKRAGLRAGDKIIKIDGESTINITISEAVGLIRGPRNTEVSLTIYRDEWEKTKDIKITRETIEIPSLKWEMKEGNIAYLKLYHFTEKAKPAFREAAIEILESPAEKIILDLRNNPGGYLEIAKDIAGWFLERGQVVVIEDFGENKGQKIHKSAGPGRLLKYPIVILINQGSASGSEILAGAIRDNREVKLIGEKSFGKGSVQKLEKLRESSFLKITIAKWLTPKGKLITNKGLEPDIIIEMTEEDFEQGRDPQLDKAIEVIRKM